MIKLAVNYSPEAQKFLTNNEVTFDLYKCSPDFLDPINFSEITIPHYIHFPFRAGASSPPWLTNELIAQMLKRSASPFINTHLLPEQVTAGTQQEEEKIYLERCLTHIKELCKWSSPDNVIVENIYPDPVYNTPPWATDARTVTALLNETGAFFLLDIAHARINAEYYGIKVEDYISALPCDRIRELHICGTAIPSDSTLLDDHFPISKSDWQIINWALEQIEKKNWRQPEIIALEHGGIGKGSPLADRMNPQSLKDEIIQLSDRIRFINKRL